MVRVWARSGSERKINGLRRWYMDPSSMSCRQEGAHRVNLLLLDAPSGLPDVEQFGQREHRMHAVASLCERSLGA